MEIENNRYIVPLSIIVAGMMISGALVYKRGQNVSTDDRKIVSPAEEIVIPSAGVTLPVRWGNFGAKLVGAGTIDAEKFKAIYDQRGTFSEEYKNLLVGENNGKLKITKNNAGYLLNLFWALGLANKNPILDSGEIKNSAYGGAGNFASTGGWTIAQGNPMNHYSRHMFFTLTPDEQALVDKVSRGIYRPCCDNSTHFPDCNHGMAMLGLLELMASQGVGEEDIWRAALTVNSYWFPDEYLTIAAYMKSKGVDWKNVNPKEILGIKYSSASGYAKIASQVAQPREQSGGNGCGVDTGRTAAPQREQSGCGI